MRTLLIGVLFLFMAACGRAAVPENPTLEASKPPVLTPSSTSSPAFIETQAISTPILPTQPPQAPIESTGTPTSASQPTATFIATETTFPKTFPNPDDYAWVPVAGGLVHPDGLTNAGDQGRLFVLEQPGRIRIILNGQLQAQPFLDITDRVGSQGSEQGLLGLAFHPDYAQNGYFYVNYTDRNGNTVISRFQVSGDPNRANPESEVSFLKINQPFPNHNGGEVTFGPDGYLFLGLGDGGSGGDPLGNGQSVQTLLGKVLRIDVNSGDQYQIPTDNPFAQGGGRPEIWAFGLRNPWRFSFDRLTGEMYIADVGQNSWEEIDYLPAGSPGGTNFGWRYYEGDQPFKDAPPGNIKFTMPVAVYGHDAGCSVTGGYVYRGKNLPEWQGFYLFGDFCSGNIWGLNRTSQNSWEMRLLYQNVGSVSSFGEDSQGELYLVDYAGTIYMLSKK